jgi:hypothetical protein
LGFEPSSLVSDTPENLARITLVMLLMADEPHNVLDVRHLLTKQQGPKKWEIFL